MKTLITSIVLKDVTPDHIKEISSQKKEPSWALDLRLKAFDASNSLPWPTLRDERWKRTELALLNFENLNYVVDETAPTDSAWKTFSNAVQTESELVRETWAKAIEQAKGNKFLLLMTLALAQEGGFYRAEKNKSGQVARLPQIPVAGGSAHFAFNIIVADDGSDLQFWEETSAASTNGSDAHGFFGSYTALILRSNAQAAHYGVQKWNNRVIHFQFQDTYQERDSRLNAIAIQMGGRIYRNELAIHLTGQGAENKILGVLFGDGQQNFENWITQNHLNKKTISDIQYRGALKGTAHSFFSGLVSIVKAAQQSDAYQSSKSLLLSKEARADAIPNLEILADDVKCAHGAAVGPVDEDQKFYLETRGVSPEDAEKIIIEGFFEPVIAEVPSEPTRDQLRTIVEEKLSRT